jgi:hypothetical protein
MRFTRATNAKSGLLFPLRLCVFAGDIPIFGCSSAALYLGGKYALTGNAEVFE